MLESVLYQIFEICLSDNREITIIFLSGSSGSVSCSVSYYKRRVYLCVPPDRFKFLDEVFEESKRFLDCLCIKYSFDKRQGVFHMFPKFIEFDDSTRRVIIMCGLPGSGKSTEAKRIAKEARENGYKTEICSADNFFIQPGTGEYVFERRSLWKAHAMCLGLFVKALMEETHVVIVDNTNLTEGERKPYVDLADKFGYPVQVVKSKTEWANDPQGCFEKGTHNVPLETIQKMFLLN